jgi:hypothetical protein
MEAAGEEDKEESGDPLDGGPSLYPMLNEGSE